MELWPGMSGSGVFLKFAWGVPRAGRHAGIAPIEVGANGGVQLCGNVSLVFNGEVRDALVAVYCTAGQDGICWAGI